MKTLEQTVLGILNACGRTFKPGPVWRAAAEEAARKLDASAALDLQAALDANCLAMHDVARVARGDAAKSAELASEIRAALAYFVV